MERKIYTTPRTKLFSVELEGTFAGSVVDNKSDQVETTGHELNEINGDSFTGEGQWNNGEWE